VLSDNSVCEGLGGLGGGRGCSGGQRSVEKREVNRHRPSKNLFCLGHTEKVKIAICVYMEEEAIPQ
jgi:hypothetical protein